MFHIIERIKSEECFDVVMCEQCVLYCDAAYQVGASSLHPRTIKVSDLKVPVVQKSKEKSVLQTIFSVPMK